MTQLGSSEVDFRLPHDLQRGELCRRAAGPSGRLHGHAWLVHGRHDGTTVGDGFLMVGWWQQSKQMILEGLDILAKRCQKYISDMSHMSRCFDIGGNSVGNLCSQCASR